MRYLLVENRNIIHRCTTWKPRLFTEELEELGVTYVVPQEESYINIDGVFELIPITSEDTPSYDKVYEHLIGPFYTYSDESVHEYYNKDFNALDSIKQELKNIAAGERYKKEIAGTMVDIQSVQVFLDTARDNRDVFTQKYAMMGDSDVVNWKFPDRWLTLTKTDLGSIIYQGMIFIQNQFDWEMSISNSIDSSVSIEELQAIVIVEE